jgi:hypothetical protein
LVAAAAGCIVVLKTKEDEGDMARICFLIMALALGGCTRNKTFVNVGHDTAVPAASVEAYARKYNLTEAEALKRMLSEYEAQREAAESKSPPPTTTAKPTHPGP